MAFEQTGPCNDFGTGIQATVEDIAKPIAEVVSFGVESEAVCSSNLCAANRISSWRRITWDAWTARRLAIPSLAFQLNFIPALVSKTSDLLGIDLYDVEIV